MKRWYVVQVYAGYEEAVRVDILRRVQQESLEEGFGEVLVPSAKLKQLTKTEDFKDQQLFPGYILVEMDMNPVTKKTVLASARVSKFLGGNEPVPLSLKEINQIKQQSRGEISLGASKNKFLVGAEVDVVEGPFAGFVGIVEKVDAENDRLVIMVNILGRMMPVELGFNQVK
jgi:transcription termination/antitermination protein NusG